MKAEVRDRDTPHRPGQEDSRIQDLGRGPGGTLRGQELLGSWGLGVTVWQLHSHRTLSFRVRFLYTTCLSTFREAEQEKRRPLSSALAFNWSWALGPGDGAGAPLSITVTPGWASHSTVTMVPSETSGSLRVRLGAGKPGGGAQGEHNPPSVGPTPWEPRPLLYLL